MSTETVGNISKIAYYPVKSAGYLESDQAVLTGDGIKGDREFMVVRANPDNEGIYNFVTQREKRNEADSPQGLAVMSLIKPIIEDGKLYLSWMGKDKLLVPDYSEGQEIPIRVWDSTSAAVDQGDEVAEWLSNYLSTPLRLVKADGSFDRPVSQKWLKNGNNVRFQDGYPVHWFTQASLDELSEKAGEEIPWHTFRPNLVVDGINAQSEHHFISGTIGGANFEQPKPCDRCPVTNVDQNTREIAVGKVLAPLSKYKSWRKSENEVKVIFGENMLPEPGIEIPIQIGTEVILLEARNPQLHYGARSSV